MWSNYINLKHAQIRLAYYILHKREHLASDVDACQVLIFEAKYKKHGFSNPILPGLYFNRQSQEVL